MRRIGRSYNNAEFFISQSTKDALHEDDTGNFGVAFAFDEPNEREEVLKWMNLEPSEENKKCLNPCFRVNAYSRIFMDVLQKFLLNVCLMSGWGHLKQSTKVRLHMRKKCIYDFNIELMI